ncbi:hypothetical protein CTAYLR_006173 [Chrysophaeum taylorii]|uniref:Protein kinase domain-containing protein n=1 Tax=Chrysophaeum taylorii TaxID=2483200 RepID=A0AAD7UPX1_9STRA|nr:hypothetical protein CTAYLR_006173 [Chrysophaeum taylorii]
MLSPVPGSPNEDIYAHAKHRLGALCVDSDDCRSPTRPHKRNKIGTPRSPPRRPTPRSCASTLAAGSDEEDENMVEPAGVDYSLRMPRDLFGADDDQHRRALATLPASNVNPFAPKRCDSLGEAKPAPKPPRESRFGTDFEVVKVIGSGTFGMVHKVKSRIDGVFYAVKSTRTRFKGKRHRDRLLAEVFALAALSADNDHDGGRHVVRYYQAWIEDERLYIQTELCDASLEQHLAKGRFSRDAPSLWHFLRQMCLALDLLHGRGLVHLDIKPANVFVVVAHQLTFKLGDFGLVSRANASGDVVEGDSRYMSKELLDDDVFDFDSRRDLTKCDVFSLGITTYEICRGGTPLPPNGPEWHTLRTDPPSLAPIGVPAGLDAAVHAMMRPDPTDRPSATSLLEDRPELQSELQQLAKQLELERNHVAEYRNQVINLSQHRLCRSNTWA